MAFFDLDDSLPRRRASFSDGGLKLDVRPVACTSTWQDIRDALRASGWDDVNTIVLDSATRAEELAVAHTIATVPHEKREVMIRRIEDYGFGKGYSPVFDTFLTLLADLDQHTREWADHVLFLGYDVDVRDGKGTGSGARTIYPCELPHCMAKSRTIADPLSLTRFDTALWAQLLK